VKRRELITLLGGAAVGWPLQLRAQQPGPIARIGGLSAPGSLATGMGYPMLIAELRKLGFTEGRNLAIEYRRTDPGEDIAFAGAAEMVRAGVQVIVASGPEYALRAAIAASPTIPIVMLANAYDPIARGYVASLARPGGRITGFFYRQPELAQKRVELLTQAFPDRNAISADQFAAIEHTAPSLNIALHSVKLQNSPDDFEAVLRTVAENGAQMLFVLTSNRFSPHREQLAALAIRHRLPTMFGQKAYVEAGGLMSYGVDIIPIWRRAASAVAKILRGAKPADLPVEQPTNFELVLNLATAKAIGIELPTGILLRADEVIE
jgi:putative ABC transport system substrate-binding protein